jgi:hypothetical protein
MNSKVKKIMEIKDQHDPYTIKMEQAKKLVES